MRGIVRGDRGGYCIRSSPLATEIWPMPRSDQPRKPQPASPTTRRAGVRSPARADDPNIGLVRLQRQTVASMTSMRFATHPPRPLHRGRAAPAGCPGDELGVSRIPDPRGAPPARDRGLVTFNPHRGAIASSLSLAEIERCSSCGRRSSPTCAPRHAGLTTYQLDQADEVLDRYAVAPHGDVSQWGELNWQFHSTSMRRPSDPSP